MCILKEEGINKVWWLTLVILAIQKAEIRKISPGKNEQDLISVKRGVVVGTYHLSYVGSVNRRITVQSSLGINGRPYLKNA
jgi:hypothetical protein